MAGLRTGRFHFASAIFIAALLTIPVLSLALEYNTFTSEDYGFSMKYPANWVKIDNPKGNYYVVFQAPDLTDKFRNRIHVAAHKPVKDKLDVFLKEMRNGITDLQSGTGSANKKQNVKILDEGPFPCDVPGAHYFFIQALEDKLNIWMDIVIVFYKQDKTLLRVSCLAPSKSMDQFHQMFNDVLVSIKFGAATQPAPTSAVPVPAPTTVTGTTTVTTTPTTTPTGVKPGPKPTRLGPAPTPVPAPPLPAPVGRGPGSAGSGSRGIVE